MVNPSERFWTYVLYKSDHVWIVKAPTGVRKSETCTEADAKLICDLHNAAVVQEMRGIHAHKTSKGWVPKTFPASVYDCKELRKWAVGKAWDTPCAALLAANAWMEERGL